MQPQEKQDEDVFMTSEELADYLRLNIQTLHNWRSQGKGPPYYKLQRTVLYRLTDIEEWMQQFRVKP